jgi:hypothetical protein
MINNNNNTSNDINENKINNRNVFRKQEMDDDFLNEFDEICGIILGIKYLFNIIFIFSYIGFKSSIFLKHCN